MIPYYTYCVYAILLEQSVSLGLLVLLLDTEDILLGKVRLFNAEHFTTLWREYIRLFDEKAEALAVQYGPDVLFTETAVCGNTHAVCKKLENLLKTLFIPSANSIEGRLHRALHAQEELLPPPSPREPFPIANHDTMQQHPDHNHEQGHPTGTRDIGNTGYDSTDQDGGQGGSHNQSDADSDADDCGAGSLDDDDDASIVPIYPASLYNQFLELQEKEQQRLEKESQVEAEGGTDRAALVIVEEKNNDNIDHIQESETSSTKQRSKNKTETNRNVLVKKSSEKSAGSSNTTSVRLTEFYPTLGSIFPAAYSQLSNRYVLAVTLIIRICVLNHMHDLCMYVCLLMSERERERECIYIYMCVRECVCIYMCVRESECIYVCVCMCSCV